MTKRISYRDVAEAIRQRWIIPCTDEGARLPTERELQLQMGVSRMTISRAMHLLTEQGFVEQRRGSGSYVRNAGVTAAPKPTLGFIAPYIAPAGVYSGPLPSLIHMGIEDRAYELGYQVVSAASHFSVDTESHLIDHFHRAGATGVLLLPVTSDPKRNTDRANLDPLCRRWRDTPIVIMDVGTPIWKRPMIGFNNYRLGYDMTTALIRHGHRHILFMETSPATFHSSIHQRHAGYLRAMEVHGLPVPACYEKWPLNITPFRPDMVLRLASGDRLPGAPVESNETDQLILKQLIQSVLQMEPRPDAVIAWEDAIAMELIRQLIEHGIQVPNEIRVVGFDNHVQGRYFQPSFPTSDPDLKLLGQMAVDMVDQMVHGAPAGPDAVQLPVHILWRE